MTTITPIGIIHDTECIELSQESPSAPRPDCLVGLGIGSRIGRQILCYSDASAKSGLWITDLVEIDDGMVDAGGIMSRAMAEEWDRRRNENIWKATVYGDPLYKEGDWIGLKIATLPMYTLQVKSVDSDLIGHTTSYELGTREPKYQDAFNSRNSMTEAFGDGYLSTDDPAPSCTHDTETITDETMPLSSQAAWQAWCSNRSGGTVSGGTLTIASTEWYAKTLFEVNNEDPGWQSQTTVSITVTTTGTTAAAKLCYQPDGAGDWIVATTLSTGTHTYTFPIARNRRLNVIVWSDSAVGSASMAITAMTLRHDQEKDYLIIGNSGWGTANTFMFTPGDLVESYNSPRALLDISFAYIPSIWCELKLTINGNASPYLIWKYWMAPESLSDIDITQWVVETENTVTVAAYFHGVLGASAVVRVSPSVKVVRRTQFGI